MFVKSLSASRQPIELFVYTASEKTWAELVIKCVESITGVRFNRPIFSRNFCVLQDREYKKGISFIQPSISKCLKKKYGVTFGKKELSERILIIDNNNVYQSADVKNILVCPTYNYKVPENTLAPIRLDTFRRTHSIINSVLRKYIPISGTTDFNQFQREFYIYYVNFISTCSKKNGRYVHDKFWLYMKDALLGGNVTSFDNRNVKYITNLVRQRMAQTNVQASPNGGSGVFFQ
jgi:hypothetical protein